LTQTLLHLTTASTHTVPQDQATPADLSINQSINKLINQSINQSINESIT